MGCGCGSKKNYIVNNPCDPCLPIRHTPHDHTQVIQHICKQVNYHVNCQSNNESPSTGQEETDNEDNNNGLLTQGDTNLPTQ